MIPMIPPNLYHQLSRQQEAQRSAMAQQALGGLQGLSQGLIGGRGLQSVATYRPEPTNKKLTFKEELQDEIDQWLEDI